MTFDPESTLALPDIASSNARFDRENGDYRDLIDFKVRSAWNSVALGRLGKLTDKKIAQYQEKGYYSADFREARRELWEKKAARRMKRDGNFDVTEDGRMIFRPL